MYCASAGTFRVPCQAALFPSGARPTVRGVERGVGDDSVGVLGRIGVPRVAGRAGALVDARPVDVDLGDLLDGLVVPHVAEAGVVGSGVAPAGGVELEDVPGPLLAPAEPGAEPGVVGDEQGLGARILGRLSERDR
jgi:hypothetical protein